MKKFDPSKTYLDLEPPKFDFGGDKITGEFDEMDTPEIEDLTQLVQIESFAQIERPWRDFMVGFTIGLVIFVLGYLTHCLIWR